jgi:hypothetical protein
MCSCGEINDFTKCFIVLLLLMKELQPTAYILYAGPLGRMKLGRFNDFYEMFYHFKMKILQHAVYILF